MLHAGPVVAGLGYVQPVNHPHVEGDRRFDVSMSV